MESYNKTLIIIPTINPTVALIDHVLELITYNFDVLVVDDGSDEQYEVIFARLRKMAKCKVIKTAKNFGHGISLKIAFNSFLTEYDSRSYNGVITTYSDEGYSPQDIFYLAEKLGNKVNTMILGTRTFSSKVSEQDINRHNVQNLVFSILDGRKFLDSTTGLRAYSHDVVRKMLDVPGANWEYELNMLQFAVENNINIEEQKINNKGYVSNIVATLNFKDAMVVINTMLKSVYKFAIIAFVAFLLDIFIFRLVVTGALFFGSQRGLLIILLATILARLLSAPLKFVLTGKYFLRKKLQVNIRKKFAALNVVKVVISTAIVSILWYLLNGSEVSLKILVDTLLFCLFYRLEKQTIFK